MSKMPWFRMYTDFLNDPKMIALAFEDQRHFIGVLALKSDGSLDQDCDPDLLDRIVAQRLWIDHAIVRDVKKRLMASGLIDCQWQPVAWDRRQMRSDADPSGAERQRRYRERQKVEKDSNALRDAAVTLPEEDTDKDKETEEIKPLSGSGEPNEPKRSQSRFPEFWSAYPNTSRRVAKAKCLQVWKSKRLDLVADQVIDHVRAMRATSQWSSGYEPAPLTYLNQRRWEDGVPDPGSTRLPGAPRQLNRQEALEAKNRQVAEAWAARVQAEAV